MISTCDTLDTRNASVQWVVTITMVWNKCSIVFNYITIHSSTIAGQKHRGLWGRECGKDREFWLDPIFWVCKEYSSRILSQLDLLDSTGSPWIADFRYLTRPELSIPAAGQKDRGLCRREWASPWIAQRCWTRPEVAILGADEKERGLWGREWVHRNDKTTDHNNPCIRRLSPQYDRQSKFWCPNETIR